MTLSGTYITDRDGMVVVKLSSGYNIGVEKTCCSLVFPAKTPSARPAPVKQDPRVPELAIISTGGTIASRIDYRTGAVTSQFDADDILTAIPALAEIGRYRTKQLYTILSENMTPMIWQELAKAIYDEIKLGVAGVIVTHGTDTMAYSAAAVSFMIDTPVPVVFVGSQRSADRPSSDNSMNAVCAACTAESELGEVAIVMHGTTNDDFCAIHRGTRVRKMHTSRRDAFKSIGIPPVGTVDYTTRTVTLTEEAVRRGSHKLVLHNNLEPHCGLIQFYPGMSSDVLKGYEGYKGLILSGTGLGHVSTILIPHIKALIADGAQVVMTSQCMNGRVCDRVYDTGRDLLAAGVIEGGDMLPEVALVKQMWVLANEKDPEKAATLMKTDLKGECMRRSAHGL